MKKIKIYFLTACLGISLSNCADYLDIVPDEILTIEHMFANRNMAEKYLFTCYGYMPNFNNPWNSVQILGEDEYWWDIEVSSFIGRPSIRIALGYQNADGPILNYWDGEMFRYDGDQKNLFIAMRDCNIFLENINTPPDLDEAERLRWIAEAKFLKAYYHLYLLQLYGPIPVMRENLPVSSSPEEVRVYREPVDEVVKFIVETLDEAIPDLPASITENLGNEGGRITRPIAMAVKAQALVWAASPIFNGNNDYTGFTDNRNRQLVPVGEPDVSKWETAAKAIKECIDTCHQLGYQLYEFIPSSQQTMSDITKLKRTIRGSVTDKYNVEQIWPGTNPDDLHGYCTPLLDDSRTTINAGNEIHCTMNVTEQFYTHNGLPMDEDPEWIAWIGGAFGNRYQMQAASTDMGIDGKTTIADAHKYYIRSGETTAKMHFYREPRFYASVGFDRAIWEANGHGENDFWLKARGFNSSGQNGENQGRLSADRHSCTGYFVKKVVHPLTTTGSGQFTHKEPYSWPVIRLADLYLLYAEALNEWQGPSAEVYRWIDMVRERAGLNGVVDSWKKSTLPNKPNSVEGLREIIKRERLIELSFEGPRFWDLRRWKDAMKYMNRAVEAWNYSQGTPDNPDPYYQVITLQLANKRAFQMKDYLWPIKVKDLQTNGNLVQNPGWPTGLKHNEKYQ